METGTSRTKLDPDGEESFVSLRRALGVTSFGMNQLVLAPRQRGRIHRHESQEDVGSPRRDADAGRRGRRGGRRARRARPRSRRRCAASSSTADPSGSSWSRWAVTETHGPRRAGVHLDGRLPAPARAAGIAPPEDLRASAYALYPARRRAGAARSAGPESSRQSLNRPCSACEASSPSRSMSSTVPSELTLALEARRRGPRRRRTRRATAGVAAVVPAGPSGVWIM